MRVPGRASGPCSYRFRKARACPGAKVFSLKASRREEIEGRSSGKLGLVPEQEVYYIWAPGEGKRGEELEEGRYQSS